MSVSKWHLNQFGHFAKMVLRSWAMTNRQATLCRNVCNNKPHLVLPAVLANSDVGY